MKKLFALLLVIMLAITACGGDPAPTEPPADTSSEESSSSEESAAEESAAEESSSEEMAMSDMNIVVSMKGPGGGNPFWASVEKGATEAGAEMGVNVTVVAPPAESDVAAQVSQIEDQLAKGVDAIVIAPTDPDALAPVLEQAMSEGVPVLFIDTKGNVAGTTFIGTDNLAGAALAAGYICDNVPAGSDVAILTGIVTQSTGQARQEGGRQGLEACGLNVVAEQSGNWDRAEGQSVMENILSGNPNITGVFASNDNMGLGAAEALKAAGVLNDIVLVGFDANPDAAASILGGEMSATIAQNPYNMGAFGVENAIKLIQGESLPEVIDTGTVLVDSTNADQYGELTPAAEQDADSSEEMAMSDMNIVVSMKGPGGGNPFWASVEKGATEAGTEMGVNVTVVAPPTESDVAAQVSQIEDQLAKGVDAIVIAPTDPDALAPVLEQAISEGVPVLFIDTKGNVAGTTFIGTDNLAGAALAAGYICDNVPAGSDVAILTGIVTQSTGQARQEGGRQGLEACGLNVVAEQSGNWDRAEGQSVMENILTGNPGITGVFASNDNMGLGAAEALKAADVLDDIVLVGFDANPDAAASILGGEMSATIAQNPYNMGAFGVENAIKLIQGETLPEVIDTGTVLVDSSNADQYGELTPAAEQEAAGSGDLPDVGEVSIVVSMKGPGGGNPFWAAVERGATERAAEVGVTVNVVAPPTESDVAAQISQIEDQLAKGVDAIVIAPTDPDALAPVLEQALGEGVPVLFIDTKGNVAGTTFIGTDNLAGAALAAGYICDNVPAGSDVAILTGIVTQSTGQARQEGGRQGLEACGLNVVAEQSGNWDRAEGQSVMENILTGNPGITGVFASNDNMGLGAAEALKTAAVLDDIVLVGFDANPDAADSILAGEMSATVAQNPYNMGAFGIDNAIRLIAGETLPEIIDTGTILVTADNAADFQ